MQPLPDCVGSLPLANRPGFVVRTGDVTGSGKTDVVVGVPASSIGAVNGGAVYVFVNTLPSAVTDLSHANLQVLSQSADARAGTEIELANTTGSGTTDIIVGMANGRKVTVAGGKSLRDIIKSPPPSPLADFLRKSTRSNIGAIVPLEQAGVPLK